MASRPLLKNRDARTVFLAAHGLIERPAGTVRSGDIDKVVQHLGFVQVDSINTLARAHDHIIWARRPRYRPGQLIANCQRTRATFENWTHDAAVIPAAFFPHWRHSFERHKKALTAKWQRWGRDGFHSEFDRILARLQDDGAQSAAQLADGKSQNGGGWWDWQPTKTALEYLWRTGELAICHRHNFSKVYDLAERVIPPEHLNARTGAAQTLDWSARAALDRLGFAASTELQAFWDILPKTDYANWAKTAHDLTWIDVEMVDGSTRTCLTHMDWETRLAEVPTPSARLRILSPFDPALRERARIERLFGFSYRIEVFVPEPKRVYGYYVFPILEGIQLTGRIDLKANRKDGALHVQGFWPEPNVRLGAGRARRLADELARIASFAGLDQIRIDFNPNTELLRRNHTFLAHV